MAWIAATAAIAACNGEAAAPADDDDGDGGGQNAGGGGGAAAGCTAPTEVTCSDQVILQMNLQDDITTGTITNQSDGAGFTSAIDATAGGAFTPDPQSYTYGKFTPTGLVPVAINDEDSLDSMDWDIAFRRYVVRINSGHSGPSCVRAARLPGAPVYDQVTEVASGLSFRRDEYFTESCDLIPDGTGLEGSPATALSSYWSYPGCVKMTDNVFVLELASGERLKLTVVSYYDPAVQEQCDTQGTIPMSATGSAQFVVRWAMLP